MIIKLWINFFLFEIVDLKKKMMFFFVLEFIFDVVVRGVGFLKFRVWISFLIGRKG